MKAWSDSARDWFEKKITEYQEKHALMKRHCVVHGVKDIAIRTTDEGATVFDYTTVGPDETLETVAHHLSTDLILLQIHNMDVCTTHGEDGILPVGTTLTVDWTVAVENNYTKRQADINAKIILEQIDFNHPLSPTMLYDDRSRAWDEINTEIGTLCQNMPLPGIDDNGEVTSK